MNGAMQRQLSIQTFQQLLSWLLHPLPPSHLGNIHYSYPPPHSVTGVWAV